MLDSILSTPLLIDPVSQNDVKKHFCTSWLCCPQCKFCLRASFSLVIGKQNYMSSHPFKEIFPFLRSFPELFHTHLLMFQDDGSPAHFCMSKRNGNTFRPVMMVLKIGQVASSVCDLVVKGYVPSFCQKGRQE